MLTLDNQLAALRAGALPVAIVSVEAASLSPPRQSSARLPPPSARPPMTGAVEIAGAKPALEMCYATYV
jgi:hypothetical protein